MSENLPTVRPGQLPTAQSRSAPIHPHADLDFGTTTPTREELWPRLHPRVRARAEERAGTTIEWWATEDAGRVRAILLGTRALVTMTPGLNADGNPATSLNVVNLDEASFRSVRITGARDTPGAAGPPGASSDSAAFATRLTPEVAGLLGQLPSRAQTMMQEPFLDSPAAIMLDSYYYLTGGGQSLSGGTFHLWCYLTDKRTLTFCAGTGLGYRTPGGAQSWSITCWRAATAPRAGQ